MTRAEWKRSKHHGFIDWRFFIPAIDFLSKVILTVTIILVAGNWINQKLEMHTIAKEIERQEKYIEESHKLELEQVRCYAEKEKLLEKNKKEEQRRKDHEKEIKECAKKYKIGDRIKIYDMNAPLVKEQDHYRWSIGDIDTITNIVDTYIYCESGTTYSYGEQIDKVRSKREWKDLVDMKLAGKLKFYEEVNGNEGIS